MRPSLRQRDLLRLLARAPKGALSSGTLGEKMGLSGPQLSRTVDALLGYGAISVQPAGREVTVSITTFGLRIHDQAEAAARAD